MRRGAVAWVYHKASTLRLGVKYRVHTRTRKMGRHFPVREKVEILNRLEKIRKIRQNAGKLQEFETNVTYYFWSSDI